jgi:photosystem II stability/assembly factor-like uncharacterized protein
MPKKVFTVVFVLCAFATYSQTIEVLHTGNKTSLRGLSVVNNKIIWVSGSNGMVGRSIDGGKTWQWINVAGYEKRDFRDIEAWDANTAIIMAIAEPAVILKTTDAGKNWKLTYQNKAPGMFLDAMEFRDKKNGMVIGDPLKHKLFVATSNDGGESWQEMPDENLPKVDSGEACFAASGTNIRLWSDSDKCIVSGGIRSRFFINERTVDIPIIQGSGTSGANSVAVRYDKKKYSVPYFVIVGGDFSKDSIATKNCIISADGGNSWKSPISAPRGYRSCVEFIDHQKIICSGTSGVDVSTDAGLNWQFISPQGFHVCRKAKQGNEVFLAGSNGTIAKLHW